MKLAGLVVVFVASVHASPTPCASCHRKETAAFADTAMSRALEAASDSILLRANPKMSARIGEVSYEITRNGNTSIYKVTDGNDTLRIPIAWSFGQGMAGQTYLFQQEGRWYESRVSYFSALKGLDVTLGAQGITPHNLLEAAGRLVSPVDVGQCFGCHATNVVKADLSAIIPGVQCDRCHGSSEAHLNSVRPMRKLAALTTEEMSDLCGQCHRTWADISIGGPRGIQNVRFQPYRLANSKCYDGLDNRIRCTACHDPHRSLQTTAAAYDAKCLACHSPKTAHICPVAAKNCVSCHMPRVELPGAHAKFTDHMIRIVKSNERYPD